MATRASRAGRDERGRERRSASSRREAERAQGACARSNSAAGRGRTTVDARRRERRRRRSGETRRAPPPPHKQRGLLRAVRGHRSGLYQSRKETRVERAPPASCVHARGVSVRALLMDPHGGQQQLAGDAVLLHLHPGSAATGAGRRSSLELGRRRRGRRRERLSPSFTPALPPLSRQRGLTTGGTRSAAPQEAADGRSAAPSPVCGSTTRSPGSARSTCGALDSPLRFACSPSPKVRGNSPSQPAPALPKWQLQSTW